MMKSRTNQQTRVENTDMCGSEEMCTAILKRECGMMENPSSDSEDSDVVPVSNNKQQQQKQKRRKTHH
jgi:hypothetical protein